MSRNNLKLNKKNLIIILISIVIVSIVLFLLFYFIDKSHSSTFRVYKITIFNGADVISNSSDESLTNMNISQFSDIGVFIDNNISDSKLTDANTIKSLYIDNISFSTGNKILNYKNPFDFGKYTELQRPNNNTINFEIINTNIQNSSSNFSSPIYYTDSSNPISLGFINENVVQNYSIMGKNGKIEYNAKALQQANVNLDEINVAISFTINITNNYNKKYYCDVKLNLDLDDDFLNNGYSYIIKNIPEGNLKFSKR